MIIPAGFLSAALLLPVPPTGNYHVGVVDVALTDYARHDAFAPNTARELVVSIYYPSVDTKKAKYHHHHHPARPYVPKSIREIIELDYTLPLGSLSKFASNAQQSAPAKIPRSPKAIIFSPGFRSSRYLYATLCEDLASHGFLVVSVDHPYDALAVEHPVSGQLILMDPSAANTTINNIQPFYTQRAEDAEFVARSLQGLFKKHFGVKLAGGDIGIFGHSLGGATALGGMLRTSLLTAGINMDGYLVNATARADAVEDVGKPYVLIGATDHSSATEVTWSEWLKKQTGWRTELSMSGSGHLSYGDFVALVDALGIRDELDPLFVEYYMGPTDGARSVELQRAYVRDFFEWQLRSGEGRLIELRKGAKKWPEMGFVDPPQD